MRYLTSILLFLALPLQADVLIINAVLVTGNGGAVADQQILVRGRQIAELGEGIDAPGVEVFDAKGAHVTAGFIDSGTLMGISEVRSSSVESDEKGLGAGAGFRAALAFNRFSSLVPEAPRDGILHAVMTPVPGDNLFAGQSALISTASGPRLVDESLAVHVYLREQDARLAGGSRATAIAAMLESLDEAARYRKNPRAFTQGKGRDFEQSEASLQVLSRVLAKERPLVVHVDRAADIETIVMSLAAYDLRLVIAGASEGWRVATLLAEAQVPVLLNVLDNVPLRFDKLGARLDNAALLADAGVTIALQSTSPFSEYRSLTQAAGVAVANGLDYDLAIRALTVHPANIWSLPDRGRLAVDANADLVFWNGDPLELLTYPTRVMADGRWVERKTRQDQLRDRYEYLTR